MPDYFIVTGTKSKPIGAICHNEPPAIDRKRQQLANNGAHIVYGPVEIPAQLAGQSIDVLMAVWRGEKPKLA